MAMKLFVIKGGASERFVVHEEEDAYKVGDPYGAVLLVESMVILPEEVESLILRALDDAFNRGRKFVEQQNRDWYKLR